MAAIFFSVVFIYAFEQTLKFIFFVHVHCQAVILYVLNVRCHNQYKLSIIITYIIYNFWGQDQAIR